MDTNREQNGATVTEHGGQSGDGKVHGHIPIFIDDVHHVVQQPTMTGAELKALGQVPPDYQLFLEVPGPAPDLGIREDEVVHLKPGMRFLSVVPGTLGAGR